MNVAHLIGTVKFVYNDAIGFKYSAPPRRVLGPVVKQKATQHNDNNYFETMKTHKGFY